jgi:hypothetical protein
MAVLEHRTALVPARDDFDEHRDDLARSSR